MRAWKYTLQLPFSYGGFLEGASHVDRNTDRWHGPLHVLLVWNLLGRGCRRHQGVLHGYKGDLPFRDHLDDPQQLRRAGGHHRRAHRGWHHYGWWNWGVGGAGTHVVQGAGGRVVWNTNGIFKGRRVRGSTFMVPLVADYWEGANAISSVATGNWATAAAALIAAVPTLAVWSRPSGGVAGEHNVI